MKTRFSILVFILSIIFTTGFSQEKSKKELKEEKKLEKQKLTEALVNSRDFVFVARTAMPTGMRSVNLSTNTNYVKFKPELIDSYMPFYGKAYSGVGYGSDAGLKFKGKPDIFNIVKSKKNFEINIEVKGETDNYKIYLSVSFEGSTYMSITSNSRSTISYQGEISAPEKQEEKK